MKTLYHGTSSVNLSCIKSVGIVPGYAKGGDAWAKEHHRVLATFAKLREPSVFVADDVINAATFAHFAVEEVGGDPIVLTLHVPNKVFDTYTPDELYQRDEDGVPHAWRAHIIDAAFVGEVLPAPEDATDELIEALRAMLQRSEAA